MDDDLTGKEFRRHGMRDLACTPPGEIEVDGDCAEISRAREIDFDIDRRIGVINCD